MGLGCDKGKAVKKFWSSNHITSQENTHFLPRKAHQQHIYNTGTEKAGSNSLDKSPFDFNDAELQKQGNSLHLAVEIELHPEISVITRYWNIQLVNDNKLWNPGIII